MILQDKRVIEISEVNKNFSKATKIARENGEAIITTHSDPSHILIDIKTVGPGFLQIYEEAKARYISEK